MFVSFLLLKKQLKTVIDENNPTSHTKLIIIGIFSKRRLIHREAIITATETSMNVSERGSWIITIGRKERY